MNDVPFPRSRRAFSLLELLMVVTISGILIAVTANQFGRQLGRDRVVRAATAVQGMLVEASQLAVRRRTPVRITLANSALRVTERSTGTVLRQRRFDPASDMQATLVLAPTTGITIFPNGRADTSLTVTLTGSTGRATVVRTATGVVRRQ